MNIQEINEAMVGIRSDNHPVAFRILTQLKRNTLSEIDKALIGIRPNNHPVAYRILTQLKQKNTERQAKDNSLDETPFQIGIRLALTGFGISDIWSAVQSDDEMEEAQRGYDWAKSIISKN